jgi:serine/threonine-protein kinase
MVSHVPIVCPNCDVDPPAEAVAGAACGSCKTPLIVVMPEEDLVGTVIDNRFEVIAKLGKGGMGTVYRATQRSIGREVALKVIDRRFQEDVVAVKRFLREAKLASALAHPNTVGVIEFGQSGDGRLYLAMELVRGKTLLEVAKGGLAIPRVIRIGVQLCDALEAAHALGIVHRDLKLENVMLLDAPNERDLVKVLDFGLARSLLDLDSRATATGLIAGTPRYLPPEVAVGGADAAPAQDLYSLGVLLGELATGTPLWEAPTLEALFAAKTHGAPRLDGVPAPLRVLIERLLDGDPEARPNAAATREALLAIGAPSRQSPVALEPTRDFEPPPLTVEPTPAPGPLTTSAFAPPARNGEVILEDEWQREKAAKQEAANQPPPKRPRKLWGIVIAVVMLAIVVTVVVIIATAPGEPPRARRMSQQIPETAHTVSIEVRTKPRGVVTFDGHKAGMSPITLHMPKNTTSVEIGTVLLGHKLTKSIIPDHDQTIDFTYP